MPFTPQDASNYKKDVAKGAQEKWASIANAILRRTGSESQAIKIANGSVRSALARKVRDAYSV